MKRTKILFLVLLCFATSWAAYSPPTRWKQVGDEILTNAGEELADDAPRLVDGEPNSDYFVHRNAMTRIWCKNGKTVRILKEVDGVIDTVNSLGTVTTKCKITEMQPIYVRIKLEAPRAKAPTDPSAGVLGL